MEKNDNSLVGYWLPWLVSDGGALEPGWDVNRDAPVKIDYDDGAVVKGNWNIYVHHGLNIWYSLEATHVDDDSLEYAVE